MMPAKFEIINQQKIKRISLVRVRRCLTEIFSLLAVSHKRISLVFCDNQAIIELNRKYFKKSIPTDVIAFPLQDEFVDGYLGEVVVSIEQAVAVAQIYGNTWQEEFILYVIHGVLHLLGYKDKTLSQRKQMEKLQKEIMQQISPICLQKI